MCVGNKITFQKACLKHKDFIFNWLNEPHVQEFWDNSQAHKDDIRIFLHGRNEPSDYADGRYVYWIGLLDDVPYALLMTIKEYPGEDREKIKNDYISTTGSTYSIEFMIGKTEYFGKGLGARTLEEFTKFFQDQVDVKADTFFIDPDVANPRAKHVYGKAGFVHVGDFVMGGKGVFRGHEMNFLVKKLPLKPERQCQENALHALINLEKDARNFGFDWTDQNMIIEQAIDECREIKEAIEKRESSNRIQEEIGDLIHSAISLCIFSGFDVEETLAKVNNKFGKRMQAIKKLTHERGLKNLQGQSIDFMLELWRKAKLNS